MNKFLIALVLVIILIILFVYFFNTPVNTPQVVVPQTQNVFDQGNTISTSSSQVSTSSSKQSSVSISNFAFVPAIETIEVGTVVTWINNDSVAHTVNGGSMFKSGTLQPGDTFSFTFTKSGTFGYSCSIHPSMKGQIIVQ